MIYSKRDLFEVVKKFCEKSDACRHSRGRRDCGNHTCELYPVRMRLEQTDIFSISDYQLFRDLVIRAADTFGSEPFYWSSLRQKVGATPLHDSWWGLATRGLKNARYGIIPGYQRSTHKSRKGAIDRRWKKL